MHVEKTSEWTAYERKEGHYYTSDDTPRIRNQRFGKPRWYQQRALEVLERTSNREVMVWYDPKGNLGKSWLCSHLYETGKAHIMNPLNNAHRLVMDACSMFAKEPKPILVINIPRTWKWTDELLVAIETIKDGLLSDDRYSNTTINIDTKVLVTTNYCPTFEKLSADRWVIFREIPTISGDLKFEECRYYYDTESKKVRILYTITHEDHESIDWSEYDNEE